MRLMMLLLFCRLFDDVTFILPIVKGRKMAFKLEENNYYLLRYNKPWTQDSVDGFGSENLELTSMDGVTIYTAKSIVGGVQFDVDKKSIQILFDTKDPTNKKVTFSGKTEKESVKQSVDLAKDFAGVLPAQTKPVETRLEIKDGMNVETIRNCDSDSTKDFGSYVLMCVDDGMGNIKVVANEPWVRFNNVVVKNNFNNEKGPNYVLWFKGKTGAGKDVAVQKRFMLPAKELDWVALQKALALKNQPVFEVNKNLYELTGGKELNSFVLKKVAGVESYPIQMQSSIEGGQNGTVAIGETLVFLQQSLVDDNTKLNIKKLDEKLVTKEGFNVTNPKGDNNIYFVANIGSPVYKVKVPSYNIENDKNDNTGKKYLFLKYNVELWDVNLNDKLPFFKSDIPMGTSKTILLPTGEVVIVGVPKVEKNNIPPLIIKQ